MSGIAYKRKEIVAPMVQERHSIGVVWFKVSYEVGGVTTKVDVWLLIYGHK